MPATNIQTALAEKRKQKSQGSWWNILKQSATEWVDDNVMTWAAAVACYTLLAMAPLLVIAVKVAAVLWGGPAASEKIQRQATNWLGGDAGGQAIAQILANAGQHGKGLIATIISAVLIVISAGGVFSEFQQAMNRIWKVTPYKQGALWAWLKARLVSVVVIAVVAVVMLASVTVTSWLEHLAFGTKVLKLVIDALVSVGVMTLLFGFMYKTVPDADIGWRSTWVGAVMSAALFVIGKFALTLYFKHASPTSAYGAVGSLAAVLIWIYYSSMILFFGAEFAQVYAKLRGHGVRPSKHARALSECNETETPTPSNEPPGQKPPKPATRGPRHPGAPAQGSPYGAVLGAYASIHPVPSQAVYPASPPRTFAAAGAGLAVGALLGGLGAWEWRHHRWAGTKATAAARVNERICRVEGKVGHASRVKHYLEQEDVDQRLDQLEQRIRAAGGRRRRRVGAASRQPQHRGGK